MKGVVHSRHLFITHLLKRPYTIIEVCYNVIKKLKYDHVSVRHS